MNRFTSILPSRLVLLSILAVSGLTSSLHAASVTGAGYTNSFDTQPPAADWSTYSITGASADNATLAAFDASVQLVAASTILPTQTLPIAMDPPDFNALATWSSSGLYLQTRPTGNGATLLMCTLVNNLGLDPGVVAISYDLNEPIMAGEGLLEGHRGYYSRTGAAGSWIPIPEFAFPLPGRVSATIDVSWPNGTTLYLLWADDNGGPSPDTTVQIDNFSVKRGVVAPLAFVIQPQNQTVTAGFPATFTALASGTSPTYQWQKQNATGTFTNIPGATATNYTINSAQTVNAGVYRIVANNSLGSITSTGATLTVVLDRFGPRMISAVVAEASSNQIRLVWDERLTPASASTMANYALTPATSTNRVPIQFLSYNPGPPSQTTITVATNSGTTVTNGWYVGGATNYILTVNNVRDISASNNVIAPNSQIGVSWPLTTNVFPANQTWQYHTSWAFDDLYNTNVYPTPWYTNSFTGLDGFGTDFGPFYHDLFLADSCLGAFQTSIGYQRQPSQFRTWFNWPAGNGSNANVRLKYTVDDGAVFYLNGVEIPGSRYNMPAGNVNSPTVRAAADIADPPCLTNLYAVSNLRPGTSNLFAVGIYQSADNLQSDIVFGMQMDVVSFRAGIVPSNTLPVLLTNLMTFTNSSGRYVRFDWKPNSYALESTVVPSGAMINNSNIYAGPWFEVQPNMTNPYTNWMANPFTNPTPSDPFRIYRLRKVNHGVP